MKLQNSELRANSSVIIGTRAANQILPPLLFSKRDDFQFISDDNTASLLPTKEFFDRKY